MYIYTLYFNICYIYIHIVYHMCTYHVYIIIYQVYIMYILCIYHVYIAIFISYMSCYATAFSYMLYHNCATALDSSPLEDSVVDTEKPCFGNQFTHVTVHRAFHIRGIGRFLNLWDVFRGTTSVHLLIIFYGIISETCRQNHPVSKPMWSWKIPSWRLTHAVVEVVCPNTAFGKDWDWSELI